MQEAKIIIHQDNICLSTLEDLLNPSKKDILGYVVRNYIDHNSCSELCNSFTAIIEETGGSRQDGFVPVHQIGSTQFMKTSIEYMDECIATKMYVDSLINNLENQSLKTDFLLEKTLKSHFAQKNIVFRPSQFNENSCNHFTARNWRNQTAGLTLLPHEDFSQLSVAEEDGFEIGSVKKVVACNLCITQPGGELILWNLEPDMDMKKRFNVEKTGYPYPIEILENIQKYTIELNAGDLFFINANCIHAVSSSHYRITLGRFMGYSSTNEIVYWT